MGRSDRGYVATDKDSKRAKNLKKLKKRKEDTGEIRRFPRTLAGDLTDVIGEVRGIESRFKVLAKGIVIDEPKERAKRKNLEEAERLQQIILDLGRKKILLQNKPGTSVKERRAAIEYIEKQKKYLEDILAGRAGLGAPIKEILKKRAIREVVKGDRFISRVREYPDIVSTETIPTSGGPVLSTPTQVKAFRPERKHKVRIRNLRREITTLEGRVLRERGRSEKTRAKEVKLSKLRRELDVSRSRLEEMRKMRTGRHGAVVTGGERDGRDRVRPSRRERRLPEKQIKRPGKWKIPQTVRLTDFYIPRHRQETKYKERQRTPRKIIFLVIMNQKEYVNVTANGWLKGLSGYNKFAIGIASVEKVSFNVKDSCDIYVNISEIAGKYNRSQDIPQDTRNAIELLCKDQIGKLKSEFFYVSEDKKPFIRDPKIVCIIPIHQRVAVTKETVNLLKQQEYLDDVILVGDSPTEESIASATNVTYVEYLNEPLSWKLQVGIDAARMSNPDAIMISGSDNWLSNNWCKAIIPYLKDYDVIGADKWWMARIEKGVPLEVSACTYQNRDDPIGGGRMITAQALNKINWGLYAFKDTKGLDWQSFSILQSGIKTLRVKMTEDVINLGIKGSWAQRDPYKNIKMSNLVKSTVLKNPEKWLDTSFPGWDKAFKRIEPTYRRLRA